MKINNILVNAKISSLIETALQVYFVNLFSGKINNTKKKLIKEKRFPIIINPNNVLHTILLKNKKDEPDFDVEFYKRTLLEYKDKIESYLMENYFILRNLKDKETLFVFKGKIDTLSENCFIIELSCHKDMWNGDMECFFGKTYLEDYVVSVGVITESTVTLPSKSKIKITRGRKYD